MTYLGIDIGGSKVAMRLETTAGLPGEVRTFGWSAQQDAADDLGQLGRCAAELVSATDRGKLAGIGVALPATLRDGRMAAWPSRPTWTGLQLQELLDRLPLSERVTLADDGSLAALAEADAAGCSDLGYLGIGTGVGGGVVSAGRLLNGPTGAAGELGHLPLRSGGPLCDCGRTGCVQATASGPATLRRAATRRGTAVTATDFVAGVEQQDGWAVQTLAETAAVLAQVVLILGELLEVTQVRVGGGFGAGVRPLAPAICEHLGVLARPGHRVPDVQPAAHGSRASLYGAGLIARDPDRFGIIPAAAVSRAHGQSTEE